MPDTRHPAAVGDQLRSHRLRAGLTQSEVAGRSGVSVRALRDIEHNRVGAPRPSAVGRLAAALGLSEAETGALFAVAPSLWIGVLGPLVVRHAGAAVEVSSRLQGDLLSLVAVQPGVVVSTDEIVDVLWGDRPPRSCVQLVHTYVAQVRSILEPGRRRRDQARTLVRVRSGYRLELEDVDLVGFARLTAQARAGTDIERYSEALDLWRGPVLSCAGERLRRHPAVAAVARQRLTAAIAYGDLAIEAGRHEEAVGRIRAVFDGEPLHEGLAARLILALAGTGGQAEALALFAQVRQRLDDELGVQPGADLQQAHVQVLRASPSLFTPRQLPAAVRHFVGRAREVAQLDELAEEAATSRRVVVAAIDGPGGIGKTTLVTHWAHGAAGRFPDGQLFMDLRGFSPSGVPVTTGEAVRGLLDALGVPPQRVPAEHDAQIGLFRSLLADKRALVVLDNARDADQVRALIPGSGTSLVVVTSRRRLTSLVAAFGAHPLPLTLLTDTEARELISRRLGASSIPTSTVDDLVGHCAGLPLAVSIVSAYATRRSVAHGSIPDGASTDVRAVFSWSYRNLDAGAARMFRLLGLHPGADIGVNAAASLAGEPVHVARARLAELVNNSLVEETAAGRFAVHDLLRAYAKELAHDDSEARTRMFDHYLHSAHGANVLLLEKHIRPIPLPSPAPGITLESPGDRDGAIRWFAAERDVLTAVIDEAAGTGFDGHAWRIAWSFITFLNRRGLFAAQLRAQRTALAAAERAGDAFGRAQALRALGGAQTHLGHHGEARANLLAAVHAFEALGDVNGQVSAHHGLGFLGTLKNDHAEAIVHSEAVLELTRAAGDQVGKATALSSLGWHHLYLGKHDEAAECCLEALALHREMGNRLGEGHTLDTLGVILQAAGDHEAALHHFRRSYDVFSEHGDAYLMATVLNHMGDSEQALGRATEARATWQRSLTLLDESGHPDAEKVRPKLS